MSTARPTLYCTRQDHYACVPFAYSIPVLCYMSDAHPLALLIYNSPIPYTRQPLALTPSLAGPPAVAVEVEEVVEVEPQGQALHPGGHT